MGGAHIRWMYHSPELTGREQVGDPALVRLRGDVKAGGDDTALCRATEGINECCHMHQTRRSDETQSQHTRPLKCAPSEQ